MDYRLWKDQRTLSRMKISPPKTIITTHERSKVVGKAFSEGCGGEIIQIAKLQMVASIGAGVPRIASYGILRGGGDGIKRARDYWHIDHGYFLRSTLPEMYDGYYRITHNNLWHNGEGNYPSDRFDSFNINLKDWRKTGEHIVVVPPSEYMEEFLGLEGWLKNTIAELKKYTDRKIVVSSKYDNPIESALPKAWALVTDHSNSGIDALIEGIPVIFTNSARKLGSVENIENPPMNREFFKNLSYQQWTLEEIRSGEAWDYVGDM